MIDERFELETRRKIFEIVKKNPGVHLSRIAQLLQLRISLVEYHLFILEKNRILTVLKETGYKRYYIEASNIAPKDKKILALLRREVPLTIVLLLLKHQRLNHMTILQYTSSVAPSTLSYHLQQLLDAGIVAVEQRGKEREYSIVDSGEISRILVYYKPYETMESFKNIWSDLRVD